MIRVCPSDIREAPLFLPWQVLSARAGAGMSRRRYPVSRLGVPQWPTLHSLATWLMFRPEARCAA